MLSVATCMSLHSCDLLTPDDIINPNVSDDTFLGSANAMQAWVNGTNRSFAEAMGNYCLLMEILSDNYFNTYSRSSQVFDIPRILYTDTDVADLQRHVGTMREMADYGINTVAAADARTCPVTAPTAFATWACSGISQSVPRARAASFKNRWIGPPIPTILALVWKAH